MLDLNSDWRPLFGPLRDYPLAVCDFSSTDPESDFEATDDVTENHGIDENYTVYHRSGHRWYYLSDQDATEILLFRQYDSTMGRKSGTSADSTGTDWAFTSVADNHWTGVPHCAIPNPVPAAEVVPRESIEVELVVHWK